MVYYEISRSNLLKSINDHNVASKCLSWLSLLPFICYLMRLRQIEPYCIYTVFDLTE